MEVVQSTLTMSRCVGGRGGGGVGGLVVLGVDTVSVTLISSKQEPCTVRFF